MSTAAPGTSREMPETASEASTSKEMPQTASESSPSTEELAQPPECERTPHQETIRVIVPDEPSESCAVVSGCVNCAQLLKENKQLTNRVKTLREIVAKRRKEVKAYRRKCKNYNYFVLPLH